MVPWFIALIFGECAKKPREVGRLGSNPDSEYECLKIKGGREVRLFFGSYLHLGRVHERKKKTGGREVRFESRFRRGGSQ